MIEAINKRLNEYFGFDNKNLDILVGIFGGAIKNIIADQDMMLIYFVVLTQ
jgi:hypothetical protein